VNEDELKFHMLNLLVFWGGGGAKYKSRCCCSNSECGSSTSTILTLCVQWWIKPSAKVIKYVVHNNENYNVKDNPKLTVNDKL